MCIRDRHEGVVVENRPGAFGNIGTAYAARATPDGYTLIMGASGTVVPHGSASFVDVP